MEETKVDIDDLLCPLIASWITIPAAASFALALHYILEVSGVLLYIIIGIFSVFFTLIAILTTLGVKLKNITLSKIASIIAIPFAIIGVIFWIGFFFIFAVINIFAEYIELSKWKYAGTFFSFAITFASICCIANFYRKVSSS